MHSQWLLAAHGQRGRGKKVGEEEEEGRSRNIVRGGVRKHGDTVAGHGEAVRAREEEEER